MCIQIFVSDSGNWQPLWFLVFIFEVIEATRSSCYFLRTSKIRPFICNKSWTFLKVVLQLQKLFGDPLLRLKPKVSKYGETNFKKNLGDSQSNRGRYFDELSRAISLDFSLDGLPVSTNHDRRILHLDCVHSWLVQRTLYETKNFHTADSVMINEKLTHKPI